MVGAPPEIVSGGSPAMSVFDYTVDGQRLYMGPNGWVAGTPVPTRFLQFDVPVAAGHDFHVAGVSFNYGASAKPSSMAGEVWYSTNAWMNSTQLTTSPLAYPNAGMVPYLGTLAVTVPSGGVFSVRIYPYAVQTQTAGSPQFAVHNSVTISGTTTPVVSCLACIAPPPNLVAWWSGDGHPSDLTTNANHGTLQGGATYAPGKVGQAFSFATTSDYVSVPDHPALNFGTGSFSIDAWVRTTAQHTVVVSKTSGGTSSNPVGYYLRVSGNAIAYGLADGSQYWAGAAITSVALNDGQWHLLAATFQRGTPSTILFYADGNHVGTATSNSINPTGSVTNTDPLLMGRSSALPSLGFPGEIDELELFNRILTPVEITALYSAGSNGKCKPTPSAREDDVPGAQGALRLEAARPNPFTGVTRLRYTLPQASTVRLELFDMLGRSVATVVDETQGAGLHEALLDGSRLAPGTYVYRIDANGRSESRTLVLLR